MTEVRSVSARNEDDEFHAFNPADWWAIETMWFAFSVPERALNAAIYLVSRPTMGICTFQLNIFDASGHLPWQNRHWRSLWQLPLPKSFRDFDMPDVGFRFETLEPLTCYRLRYASGNAAFDVTWTALIPPSMLGETHFDQFGHVVGWLELDGERIAVDSVQMRDRSWSSRSDLGIAEGGYTYALASADHALFMISTNALDSTTMRGGWLVRDGRLVPLAKGERRITRRGEHGQPLGIRLTGVDAEGREFLAEGTSLSRSVVHTAGNILAWDSLIDWRLDGLPCYGEDHDVWAPTTFPRGAAT
jgi:hypothetical protein